MLLLVYIIAVPLLLIAYMIFSFKFAKFLLYLLPIFIVIILSYFWGNTIVQLLKIFLSNCLFWVILALVIVFFLTKRLNNFKRGIICLLVFLGTTGLTMYLTFIKSKELVKPFSEYTIESTKIYRSKGDSIELNKGQNNELSSVLHNTSVQVDLMGNAKYLIKDNDKTWYKLDIESDNKNIQIVIFPLGSDEYSFMQVSINGNISYNKGIDNTSKFGTTWFSNLFKEAIKSSVIRDYQNAFRSLQNSFKANSTTFSFVVPEGLPGDYTITIVGRPVDGAMVRFLEEYNKSGFEVGKTYSFDVSSYSSFRYLYLSINIYGEDFDLINIYDYLPDKMKGVEQEEYYEDLVL